LQKDGATFFAVDALTTPSKEITQTLKRYSDFEIFNEKMHYAYEENHSQLAKNLPDFPIKRSKLLEDHDSKEFIESRRLLLQAYLHKLLKVPHANENPHFWKFLGLVDYAYYAGQMTERLINPDDRTQAATTMRASIATPSTTSSTSSSTVTSDDEEEDTKVKPKSVPSSPKSSSSSVAPVSPKSSASPTKSSGSSGFSNLFKKENPNTTATGVKKVQTRQKQTDDDENDDL